MPGALVKIFPICRSWQCEMWRQATVPCSGTFVAITLTYYAEALSVAPRPSVRPSVTCLRFSRIRKAVHILVAFTVCFLFSVGNVCGLLVAPYRVSVRGTHRTRRHWQAMLIGARYGYNARKCWICEGIRQLDCLDKQTKKKNLYNFRLHRWIRQQPLPLLV